MTFKDHFSRLAGQYSNFRPRYPRSVFEWLAGVCDRRDMAWDCGCGGGQATLSLAEYFGAVVGTDASAAQVAAAPSHPKVQYRVAQAEDSGLPAASVDLVIVAQALHWFDLDGFYAEVRRVLRDKGVLAVWTYGVVHVEGDDIDRLIQQFYHETVGPFWPPERRLVEEGYRGLPFPFEPLSPPPFSMEEYWERTHLLGYLRTWSATGRYVEAKGIDPVAHLEKLVAPLWPDPTAVRKITWPLALRVGTHPG